MFKIKLTTLYCILSMILTPIAYYQAIHVNTVVNINMFTVTATMYNAVEDQCNDDPLITAGMYKINPDNASQHRWVALSRNLLKRWGGHFDYGDIINISGAGHKDGIYKVVDTMNKRFIDRIDFLETTGTKLYKFNNVIIEKIGV